MIPRVLFVVEGGKVELRHVKKTAESLLALTREQYQISVFGSTIHRLYRSFSTGKWDSIVSYLAEEHPGLLQPDEKPNEVFSAIYLVFDFDPQDPNYSAKELLECAEHFSDETRYGKLYLNYPMFESLRDLPSPQVSDYLKLTIPVEDISSKKYKKIVNSRTIFRSITSGKVFFFIPPEQIPLVLAANKEKYQLICYGDPEKPFTITDGSLLLNRESALVEKQRIVSILNSFVLLLLDYNPNLYARFDSSLSK